MAGGRVLVVGAGPTGLTAALFLARRGFETRVVDRHAAALPFSRALMISPQTLALFAGTPVAPALVDAGRPARRLTMRGPRGEIAAADLPRVDAAWPNIVLLPQIETERIIAHAAYAAGVVIERPVTLERAEQATDRAIAHLVHHNGRRETAEVDWIVGADGFRSATRGSVGARFDIETLPQRWFAMDVRAHWPWPADLAFWLLPEGFCAAFRYAEDEFRLVAATPGLLDRPPEISPPETIWRSDFEIHFAQADIYGKGRVWLAGDAAHVHSPAGGRGMNMGIADGVALAHAIADGDLDGFVRARHAGTASFISLNRRASRMIALHGWRGRAMRAGLRALLGVAPSLIESGARRITGIDG